MRRFAKYLGARDRKNTPVVYGEIASRNQDGSYQVTRTDTRLNVRATRSDANVDYEPGTTVVLSRDTAINRHVGYVIIGLPGLASQGTNRSPNDSDTFTSDGIAVFSWEAIEVRRGESETLIILGAGFTAAPTSDETGITITTVSLTSSRIEVTVAASYSADLGYSNLTLGSVILRDAVRVRAAGTYLYATRSLSNDHIVYKFDVDTLDLVANTGQIGATGNGTQILALADATDRLYALQEPDALVTILKDGFTATTQAITGAIVDGSSPSIVWDGTHVWMPSANGMLKVLPSTGAVILEALTTGFRKSGGVYAFGSVWTADRGGSRVRRINPADGSFATCSGTLTATSTPRFMGADATYVYVLEALSPTTGTFKKVDPNTNAIIASVDVGGGLGFGIYDGHAYIARSGTDVMKVLLSNMSIVTSVAHGSGNQQGRCAAHEDRLFVATTSETIEAMSLPNLTAEFISAALPADMYQLVVG